MRDRAHKDGGKPRHKLCRVYGVIKAGAVIMFLTCTKPLFRGTTSVSTNPVCPTTTLIIGPTFALFKPWVCQAAGWAVEDTFLGPRRRLPSWSNRLRADYHPICFLDKRRSRARVWTLPNTATPLIRPENPLVTEPIPGRLRMYRPGQPRCSFGGFSVHQTMAERVNRGR